MTDTFRPLLASYGGGHAHIIAALTKRLIDQGADPDVIGFTTAHQTLRDQGIDAKSVTDLLDPIEDAPWLEQVYPFVKDQSHPTITAAQTQAYFALGLRDLAGDIGLNAALEQVRTRGRKAFEPVATFRRYLRKTRPDFVLATNSPRFELALLKAARAEGIPHLAVCDLFLAPEQRSWILAPDYATNIAVLSQEVADSLVADGMDADQMWVTGNPAFDALTSLRDDKIRRDKLRLDLGLSDKTVILFPAAGGTVANTGQPFLTAGQVSQVLDAACERLPDHRFIIRPHPNFPATLPDSVKYGTLDDGSHLTVEDAILVSDVVLVEVSTVGLQAALAGKSVICIGFSDYVLYPKFGLGTEAATLEEAVEMLVAGLDDSTSTFQMPPLGTAVDNVMAAIAQIQAKT